MLAALYAIAMVVLVVYGTNLLWLALIHARHDKLKSRIAWAGAVNEEFDWPPITVQVPLYNEVLVAEGIIDACVQLDYPRLEIQVLDDSTDETRVIARERVDYWRKRGVAVHHICRNHRSEYKAGALKHGLSQATGAFIAIFDADFAPPPDLLKKLLPAFRDASVGMVQARWGHLNAEESVLTRVQAYGLDAYFAIEQAARMQAGCFINFNGTAGMWRRDCIEDAGGWQGDTLAEDLDLSYRAQLRGWKFQFMCDIETPAELPQSLQALRAQQFRWTKGAAEAAMKLMGRLWRSAQPLRVKLEGSLHLTAHLVFPALCLAMLLHVPLLMLEHTGNGPGETYFAIMGLGLVGFLGFFLEQALAQRALYPDWPRRLLFFPVFVAGSMGLAVNNSHALWQAVRRKKSEFVRTPKYNSATRKTWGRTRYTYEKIAPVAYFECAFALYSLAGLAVLIVQGDWAAGVFQTFFAAAFVLMTFYNIQDIWLRRTSKEKIVVTVH